MALQLAGAAALLGALVALCASDAARNFPLGNALRRDGFSEAEVLSADLSGAGACKRSGATSHRARHRDPAPTSASASPQWRW